MTQGIDHIALSVSNLENSIQFYQSFGKFEVNRIIESKADVKLGAVIGIPNAKARIAHLTNGSIMLELFEYKFPKGKVKTYGNLQSDIGFTHIGFRSEDTRQDYKSLRNAGVEFISEPIEFRPGVWICYFYGPDGEVCELRQVD